MRIYQRENIWYVDSIIDGKRTRCSTGLMVHTGDAETDKKNKKSAERISLQKEAELARKYAGGERIHDWLVGKRRQLQRWKIMLPDYFTWNDITLKFLQDMVKGMEKHGKIVKKHIAGQEPTLVVEPYSNSTIHSYLDEITSMVKQAAKRGECGFPEWERKDIYRRPRTSSKKKVVHTNEEIEKLLKTEITLKNEILGEVWDTIPAWKFVLCTGLRFGDVYDLKWADIINSEVYIKMEKTEKFIQIPMNHAAVALLDQMKRIKPNSISSDKIFNLPNHTTTLEHLEKWRIKAGIQTKVLWHAGRRDFATILHECGSDIYTISKLLGHSDVRVTQRYVQLTDKKMFKAVNNLDNHIRGLGNI